jgi:hypothetical protein
MRPNGKKRVEIPWKYIGFPGAAPEVAVRAAAEEDEPR